ncbi:MAG: hypothetical protein V8Q84_03270 [Bilophila sp.]
MAVRFRGRQRGRARLHARPLAAFAKRHGTQRGKARARPSRAVLHQAGTGVPGLPLLAGGPEASLHHIWSDALRGSILFDARLDILSSGMGERCLLDVARRLDAVADARRATRHRLGPACGTASPARRARENGFPSCQSAGRLQSRPPPPRRHARRILLEGSILLERETHQARRALVQPDTGGAAYASPRTLTTELDAFIISPSPPPSLL